jgi:hypothetical protein
MKPRLVIVAHELMTDLPLRNLREPLFWADQFTSRFDLRNTTVLKAQANVIRQSKPKGRRAKR